MDFSRLLTFNGRMNRKQYIIFAFVLFGIYKAVYKLILEKYLITKTIVLLERGVHVPYETLMEILFWDFLLYGIVFLVLLPIRAQRFHDLNKSAWYLLLFVPDFLFQVFWASDPRTSLDYIWLFAYAVPLNLYLYCFKGTKGENKYGKDPLEKEELASVEL